MRRAAAALLVLVLVPVAGCGDDDDDGSAASAGSFCERAGLVEERFAELEASFEGTEVPDASVFETAADTLEDLADGAPEEIADDLGTIADGSRRVGEVFSEFDFNDQEAMADPANAEALGEIASEMEQIGEDVESATAEVEAYLESECGVSLDDE